MSHDIRTPMNAITGITSLLEHDAGNEEKVREYAKKIDADYYAKDAKSSVEIAKLTF